MSNLTPIYPNINTTNLVGVMQQAQQYGNVPIGVFLLLMFIIAAYFTLKRFESVKAIPSTLFLASLLAMLLNYIQLLDPMFFYASIVGLAISVWALFAHE